MQEKAEQLAGYYGHCLIEKAIATYYQKEYELQHFDKEIYIILSYAKKHQMTKRVIKEVKDRMDSRFVDLLEAPPPGTPEDQVKDLLIIAILLKKFINEL